MKEIILSSGDVCIVDDDDYDFLNQWNWKAVRSKSNIYAGRNAGCVNGKWNTVLMHRLLLDAKRGEQVDHVNHKTLDNRRSNIRLCNQSQNNANGRGYKNRASKFKGVSRNGSGWIARIKKDGVCIRLGTYRDEEAAARAYDAKALEVFGEFAHTNFSTCANA